MGFYTFNGQESREQTEKNIWWREGSGFGKGPRNSNRTLVTMSTFALCVCALTTKLLAMTNCVKFLTQNFPVCLYCLCFYSAEIRVFWIPLNLVLWPKNREGQKTQPLLKIPSFVFHRRNKVIQVYNNMRMLMGSYDAISSFSFSLECYKLCIDKIPEVTKTKVSTQRDILYKSSNSSTPP